jgi:hypothetical protein
MDTIFEDFKYAFEQGDGYGLSQTLSPIDPPSQPGRLRAFIEVRTQQVLVKISNTESYMITLPLSSYLRRRAMAGLKSTLRIGRQWARY